MTNGVARRLAATLAGLVLVACICPGAIWMAGQVDEALAANAQEALSRAGLHAEVTLQGREAIVTGAVDVLEKAVSVVRDVPGVAKVASAPEADLRGGAGPTTITSTSTSGSASSTPTQTAAPLPSPTPEPSASPTPQPAPDVAPIYFQGGSSELSVETKEQVRQLAKLLLARPELSVTLTGHTDNGKTAAQRNALGLKRAKVIAAELETQGIAENRVLTASQGGDEPAADNATAEGRAANRRVEVILEVVP